MAAKAKATDVASESVQEALHKPHETQADDITYVPGPDDRAHTEFAGIRFVAGVPQRVPRSKTVLVPLPRETTTVEGAVVTRHVEQRVPVVDLLKTNPFFSINGKPPPLRMEGKSRLPQDPDHYRKWAMEWIHKAISLVELETRWAGEAALREKCGVSDTELNFISPFLEMKLEQLRSAEAEAA